ncbi:MAG: hypothetical protein EPO08_19355 [Rhodospirillaceae bacterium]|nr:MAG: hypothetical protein EPO08_19355 [Rhodospirillaceae bacterium]
MSDRPQITDEELHAYIDGELSRVRAADITALAQYDRELARKIAAFRADKARLVELYGPVGERPVPAAWLHTIERAQRRSTIWPSRQTIYAIAASLALMVVSMATYKIIKPSDEDPTVAQALAARHESLVMTDAAGTVSTMEAANHVVQDILGPTIKTPDLSKLGYTLAAAHAMPERKAVTIDYRDGQNHVFTVYLSHSPGTERFDMLKRGATRICVWQDEELSAVMVGEMSAGEMLRLATLAYAGLTAA